MGKLDLTGVLHSFLCELNLQHPPIIRRSLRVLLSAQASISLLERHISRIPTPEFDHPSRKLVVTLIVVLPVWATATVTYKEVLYFFRSQIPLHAISYRVSARSRLLMCSDISEMSYRDSNRQFQKCQPFRVTFLQKI